VYASGILFDIRITFGEEKRGYTMVFLLIYESPSKKRNEVILRILQVLSSIIESPSKKTNEVIPCILEVFSSIFH